MAVKPWSAVTKLRQLYGLLAEHRKHHVRRREVTLRQHSLLEQHPLSACQCSHIVSNCKPISSRSPRKLFSLCNIIGAPGNSTPQHVAHITLICRKVAQLIHPLHPTLRKRSSYEAARPPCQFLNEVLARRKQDGAHAFHLTSPSCSIAIILATSGGAPDIIVISSGSLCVRVCVSLNSSTLYSHSCLVWASSSVGSATITGPSSSPCMVSCSAVEGGLPGRAGKRTPVRCIDLARVGGGFF